MVGIAGAYANDRRRAQRGTWVPRGAGPRKRSPGRCQENRLLCTGGARIDVGHVVRPRVRESERAAPVGHPSEEGVPTGTSQTIHSVATNPAVVLVDAAAPQGVPVEVLGVGEA